MKNVLKFNLTTWKQWICFFIFLLIRKYSNVYDTCSGFQCRITVIIGHFGWIQGFVIIYKKILILNQDNIFAIDRFVWKHWFYSFPKKIFVASITFFIKVFTIFVFVSLSSDTQIFRITDKDFHITVTLSKFISQFCPLCDFFT